MAEQKVQKVQKVETEFVDSQRVGGFLAAMMIFAYILGIYSLLGFFIGLAMLVSDPSSGNEVAFATSLMVGGLLCSAGFIATGILINFRKKLAKLFAWITLGIYFIANSAAWISLMTVKTASYSECYSRYSSYSSYRGCDPTYESMPAGIIVMFIGFIFVAALEAGLAATYFIISKRAKATLVK